MTPQSPDQAGPPEQAKTHEKTEWSPGLIVFYTGCALVSLGAAITFSGVFVFVDYAVYPVVLGVGITMVVTGALMSYLGLRAARRER